MRGLEIKKIIIFTTNLVPHHMRGLESGAYGGALGQFVPHHMRGLENL